MKITYAITVCNEFIEIQRLVGFLLQHKRIQDNIVILYDEANGDPEIENFLRSHSVNGEFAWHKAKFDRHFANWKNKLTSFCTGDYIFQIDADEIPHEKLIELLPEILEENIECDVIMVPRVNTVEGLTPEHIQKWRWNVNEKGWVNWPDEQWRIYKNKPEIKWVNKVHERLEGFKVWTHLPIIEEFALYHPKTIDKQEKQNNLYNNI
jgi:glycosyltransferase involved in cell wall biosynthesis